MFVGVPVHGFAFLLIADLLFVVCAFPCFQAVWA